MPRSRPKTQGRAFEVAGYRYDAIFRPLEQLLVPKESRPGQGRAGRKPAPVSPPGGKPAPVKPAPAS